MIWHYFPIGMRFPVEDFSDRTKRACWQIALSAVFAADVRNTGLYEACESYDPVASSPVYTCIVCYVGIKQSRAAGEKLHALDALMTQLCLCNPLVQANYLENFGPYPILAQIDGDGAIHPNEIGAAFIPTGSITPMTTVSGLKILIAPDFANGACDAERLSRVLGTAAVKRGFRVRRMPVADGGAGTVRALITGTGGRFETVSCEDQNGERANVTVGVLPGPVAVIESADAFGNGRRNDSTPSTERRSDFCVGSLIRKVLDLGYRKIWVGVGGANTDDLGLGALSALGVRFLNVEGDTVAPLPETLFEIVRIDRSELDPRIAQTELTLLYDAKTTLLGENGLLHTMEEGDRLPQDRIESSEKVFSHVAQLLGGDPNAPGSGAGGGLGFALAAIGGTLQNGAAEIPDRIGFAHASREADFIIMGSDGFDGQSARRANTAFVTDLLSDADRPGCLLTGQPDADALLQANPNLKGVAVCPAGEASYELVVTDAFERQILPMIGKDTVNNSVS